jgi:hypothetical protein
MLGAMKGRAGAHGIAGLLLAGLLGACASTPRLELAPAVQDTDLRGEDGGLEARVVLAWLGVAAPETGLELCFRMRVENPGPTPFTLVPAQFELLDGALVSFGPPRTEALPVLVEPGRAETFDLVFALPPGARLQDRDLSTLTLGVRLQGGRWSWSKSFTRVVPHPHPAPFGFSFGAGWVVD